MNTKALKVFFVYALVSAIFVAITLITTKVFQNYNLNFFFLRIFNICEFTLISLFLIEVLKNASVRKVARISIVAFAVFALVDYFISDKNQFNNHSNIVSSLILIAFLVYFFYEKMNTVVMYPLYQTISFWICVGLFLYFTGSFFFFIFIKSSVDKALMNNIYAMVVIIKNIILSLSLLATEPKDDSEDTLHIPTDLDLDELSPLSNPKN